MLGSAKNIEQKTCVNYPRMGASFENDYLCDVCFCIPNSYR